MTTSPTARRRQPRVRAAGDLIAEAGLPPVAGIEKCAAKLGRRQRDRIIAARQSCWWDVEIAIEIDCERALEHGAQA